MSTPAQWQWRKLTTVPYQPNQKQTIDLRKYETDGVFDRIVVKLTGNVNTGSSSAGTATGADNPESLLTNVQLVVTPAAQGLIPFNQVSGRTLRVDRDQEDWSAVKCPSLTDDDGSQAISCEWHMIFQRRFLKRGIEYAFDIGRYTGASLNLTFGDQSVLFSGSSNVWNFSNVNVEIWGLISYNVTPQYLHAVELFENIYPVTASNPAMLIDNLPNGAYYGDLVILAESNGALSNAICSSFDLSSGSRSWMFNGDSNADFIQRELTQRLYSNVYTVDDPTKPSVSQTVVGQYALTRLGKLQSLLTKAPDALISQLLIRVNAAFTSGDTQQLRLFGRKIVPGGVYKAPSKTGSTTTTASPGSPS